MKTILSTALSIALLGGVANASFGPSSDQQALPRASGYEQALPRSSNDEFRDALPRSSNDDFRQALALSIAFPSDNFPDVVVALP
jgi:hypothetical protein